MMQAKLLIVGGRASSPEIELELPLTIGRGDQAWLRLKHPTISRKHCEISEVDGKLFVRDCGSANGTLIDGERITEAVLEPGHTLTVGPLTFEAQYEPSLNGKSEDHSSETVAETAVDPTVGTLLTAPGETSLAPPAETPQPTAEPPVEESVSDDLDDLALSLDDEDDLIEPPFEIEDAASSEPAPTLEAAETSPEEADPDLEFDLDLKLDDELEVEGMAEPNLDEAMDLDAPLDDIDAVSADDEAGATIEADSNALAAFESDASESDFELDLAPDNPPDVEDSATTKPEIEEAIAELDDTEDEEPAAVTEDVESVRDFSGPMVDMPSQILFSIDEIDEPLLEPSDEGSAIQDEADAAKTAHDEPATDDLDAELDVDDLLSEPTAESAVPAVETSEHEIPDIESVDDPLDVVLDDDTADGDLSDITDSAAGTLEESHVNAEKTIPDAVTSEPISDDPISDLDLELDSADISQPEGVREAIDEASPRQDETESDFLEDSSAFEDSAELQWSDAASVKAEPQEEVPDAVPDLDLSEMALEAIDGASDLEQDREGPSAEPPAESEAAALDLSELALDAVGTPADEVPIDEEPLGTTGESEPADLDLSEMALDAIGSPKPDSNATIPSAENAGTVADKLDLSEVAFDAVKDATTSDDLPQPADAKFPSSAEDLDLSELALGELGAPSDSQQPAADDDEAPGDVSHVERSDATVNEVDFALAAEGEAVDLESDADFQVDELDLSEMAFDGIEINAADLDESSEASEIDLPEVEFDANDDFSEADDAPLPAGIEQASGTDGTDQRTMEPVVTDRSPLPLDFESESESGSDDFEVPELAEGISEPVAEAPPAAEAEEPVKIEFEADSDLDSADFSEFDFGSDEDASSEISLGDESSKLDLPSVPDSPSITSDATVEPAATVAEESPKKKRGWWPFGRKAKADVELPMADLEVSAESDLEANDALDLDRADATSDEFDAAALFGEPLPEGGNDEEESNNLDEAPVAFEAAEDPVPGAVEADEPSSDLVDDLLFEDEDSAPIEMPPTDAHVDADANAADAEIEDNLEGLNPVEFAEANVEPDVTSEAEDSEIPSFEDDDSEVVSLDPVGDDATNAQSEIVAEVELDDEPVDSPNSSIVADEPPPEAKPKRSWWSLGKKSSKAASTDETSKLKKAKRGWGRRKKKAEQFLLAD